MAKEKTYRVADGDRLFFRLSKSGEGVYVTSEHVEFGLRGNFEHVKAVLRGQKDFAVLEVRPKQNFKTPVAEPDEEDIEEEG